MARDLVLLSIPPSSPPGSTAGEGLGAGVWSLAPLNLPTPGVDFQTFATHAAELARILTGATGSAIAFRENGGTICRARSGQGAPRIGAPVDTTSGISRQCLDSGALLYCADTATDSRIDSEAARALGIRAVAVVPIRSNGEDGEIVGILEVFSGTPGIFSDRHLKTLHHVAILIGSAARTPGEVGLQNLTVDGGAKGQPDLALLLEREPALLAFFRNLATVFSLRRPPRAASILQEEWHYVVIDSRMPWRRFFQSVLLHVTVLAAVVGLARIWPRQISLQPRRYEHITYYPFSGAAPVFAESRPVERAPRRHASTHSQLRSSAASAPDSNTVSASNASSGSTPPPPGTQGVAIRGPQLPVAMAVPPPPGLEAAAPQHPRLSVGAVVAPPPDLGGGPGSREISEPTAGVVPPPPEMKGLTQRAGLASGYGGAAGATSIVPPPPTVDGHAGLGRSGASGSNLDAKVIGPPPSMQAGAGSRGRPSMALGGAIQVVPPPPSLQGTGSYGGGERIGSLGRSGSGIVPPPPSLQSAGYGRAGRGAGLGRSSSGIVPPPPSLQGAVGSRGGARIGTLGGSGSEIVPPPPSVLGAGGYGRGGTRVGSLAGSGSQVVPPPPSLRGTGTRGGGGNGIGTLVGAGSGIVPPPPSVQGGLVGSSAGRGGGNGLASVGSEVVPPSPSIDGGKVGGGGGGSPPHFSAEVEAPAPAATAGNGSGSANASPAKDIPTMPATPPTAEKETPPTFQNVQLRVIVSAWAPPRSSYFANYEVFIAQKWLNKETPQLIKLVYVFLPYQRRLSEYGADGWKVRKLRVVRDPSCDESLMQIEWPEGVDASAKANHAGAVGEKPPDRDRPLPCYRTTADDYRKAVSSR